MMLFMLISDPHSGSVYVYVSWFMIKGPTHFLYAFESFQALVTLRIK